jgi:galactose mutarotase-like enzyme
LKTTISSQQFSATINSLGAELISLKNNSAEYIWEGNPTFWGKHSPVLFPIVGTLKNNSFTHNNKEYQLSRHGFAREMEFEVVKKTENSVSFLLVSNEKTIDKYPFHFQLSLTYTLINSSLDVQYEVINTSEFEMFFSIGAHPAFALPNSFENYSLAFEENELHYNLLENDLLSNKQSVLHLNNNQLDLNYNLFKNDALVFKQLKTKSITILEKTTPLLKVHFSAFPNLGIWTKVNAPFICIEPWFGYSDSNESSGNLSEKEAILKLAYKATFQSNFTIEIL